MKVEYVENGHERKSYFTRNKIKYSNHVLFVSLISQKQSTTDMFHLT